MGSPVPWLRPPTGVLDAEVFGEFADDHFAGEQHRPCLEEKCEAAARTRPGHLDLMQPGFGTIRPRDGGNGFGLVLPGVEMAPAAFPPAEDTALLSAGTGKRIRSFDEIDGEIFGLASRGAGSHNQRMRQRKGLREDLIRDPA